MYSMGGKKIKLEHLL